MAATDVKITIDDEVTRAFQKISEVLSEERIRAIVRDEIVKCFSGVGKYHTDDSTAFAVPCALEKDG